MANFKALVHNLGRTAQVANADSLIVGAGLTSAAGNLTIGAVGTNVVLAAGKTLTAEAGAGAVDFSTMTGLFKTTTGAVTIGPGAVTMSGVSTFTGPGAALVVTNDASIGGALQAGSADVNGTLSALGNTTLGADLSVAGTLNGASAALSGSLSVTGSSSLGDVGVSGGLTAQAVSVDGAFAANSTSTLMGAATLQSTLAVTGAVTMASTLAVTGNTTITGNLTVNGTTTTINSATLDVTDRMIHANHSTGADDPVPAAITGLAIHRGAVASVARDHAAIVWDEANSRWNFALNTAGDDATLGADQAVKMGALTVTAGMTQSGGAVSMTANGASSMTTSAGALTLSGFSALNLQEAGSTVLSLASSAATLQASKTLDASAGTFNMPDGADTQIAGVALDAAFTAANVNTLIDGSNADALHTHAGLGATSVMVTGLAGENIDEGEVVTFDDVAGSPRILKSDADGAGELADLVGIASATVLSGASLDVQMLGEISVPDAEWDSVPAASDVGKRCFLSATAGNLTLTAPSASGTTAIRVGWVTRGGSGLVKVAVLAGEGVLN